MAKSKKMDQKLTDRFSKKSGNKRKEGVKEMRIFFLIVCEGAKTEPNYFRSFPGQINNVVYELQFDGGGINTIQVVDKAIELKNKSQQPFDRVWAVFDKDDFKETYFNRAITKGQENGVRCAWSNEAFELWFLLHFQYRNTPMPRIDYAKEIAKAINEKQQSKSYSYAKNAKDMYGLLQQYGSEDDAIRYAEKLCQSHYDDNYAKHNPCTTVHKLVNELRGKDEDLNREIEEKYKTGE